MYFLFFGVQMCDTNGAKYDMVLALKKIPDICVILARRLLVCARY